MNIDHFDAELEQWQELDGLALLAEYKLEDLGRLSAGEAAALVQDAFERRRIADSHLLRALRSPKAEIPRTEAAIGRRNIVANQTATCEA